MYEVIIRDNRSVIQFGPLEIPLFIVTGQCNGSKVDCHEQTELSVYTIINAFIYIFHLYEVSEILRSERPYAVIDNALKLIQ